MPRQRSDSDAADTVKAVPIRRAWRSGWAIGAFVGIAALAAGADLWTKHLVFSRFLSAPTLPQRITETLGRPPYPDATPQDTRYLLQMLHIGQNVCPGLRFTLSTNPGVVFGIHWLPTWGVNLITGCMILFVAVFFGASEKTHSWLHVALAMILGGAIGNLYDRLASSVSLPHLPPIRYHVRDFLDCSTLGYPYIFNVADVWLVVGVVMILLYWLWTGRTDRTGVSPSKHA